MRLLTLAAALAATCSLIHADFSYQESTQLTGGSMLSVLKLGGPFTRGARAAQVSSVAVKGNRMVRSDKDSVSIIDLDKETVTDIDLSKKQYSVTTFAQMRAAMEQAIADAKKRGGNNKPADNRQSSDVELQFKVTAKASGRTKDIGGLTAKELLIGMEMQGTDTKSGQTGSFNVANEGWMADVGGYEEVKAFQLKMATKLASAFRPGMEQLAATQPLMVQGLAEVSREMAKVEGVPVQIVTRIGSGSPEELQAAAEKKETENANDKKPSAGAAAGAVAGALTGFGGFGRRRNKEEDKSPQEAAGQKEAPGAVLLMEMTANLSDFSTAPIDETKFQVPAGFKEVRSAFARAAK